MVKIRALITFAFLLFTSSASATYMSGLAAGLAQGQFIRMQDANMSGWLTNGGIMVTTGCPSNNFANVITQYGNKAVWNPISKTFQYVGSAHGGCGVPNPKMVKYNDTTDSWTVGPQPPSIEQPQHTYDMNTINPNNGRHYFTGWSSTTLQSLDSGSSGPWVSVSTNPMSSHSSTNALAWFPDYGGGQVFWLDGDWGLWAFNPANSQWTHLYRTLGDDGSGLPILTGIYGNSPWMEYSSLCQCLVIGGSDSGGATIWRINANGSSTQLSLSGGPSSVTCCSGNSSVSVDPVGGKLLIMQNTILWEFNPTNSVWVNTGISIPSYLSSSGGTGFDMIAAPISDYGVVMYVKCTSGDCQAWLYKHGVGTPDTTAPTAPSGLVATAASSSQINLTWTASTDNVGVAGYNVERCQGASCSSFTQVYTPSTNSQNDTGLTASTTYGYRVRAYDGANNLSGYTSPTQYATTSAGGGGGSDFASRCKAAGVLRCMGFDDPADLFIGAGSFNGAYGYNYGFMPDNAYYGDISLDTSVKSDGASALRFAMRGNTGSGTGAYFLNFTNPASTYQVGEGQDVYIQWRQRWSPEMINTVFWAWLAGQQILTLSTVCPSPPCSGVTATLDGSSFTSFNSTWIGRHLAPRGGGTTGVAEIISVQSATQATVRVDATFNQASYGVALWQHDHNTATYKYAIISQGDLPSCDPANPGSPTCPTSCYEATTVTTNNADGINVPTVYANCAGPNPYFGFYGNAANFANYFQNVVGCPYPLPVGIAPCVPIAANEWITFQEHIHVGNWNVANSTFQLWVAREGQPSVLVIECSPTVTNKCQNPHTTGVNYFNSGTTYRIGKFWMTPYMTDKSQYQAHATGYTWYDEVIISTAKIADPGGAVIAPPSNTRLTRRMM